MQLLKSIKRKLKRFLNIPLFDVRWIVEACRKRLPHRHFNVSPFQRHRNFLFPVSDFLFNCLMEQKSLFARWRGSFFTGLAVILPGALTLAVVKWLFGTVASFTDLLLFFLPARVTHDPTGPVHWYWSLVAIAMAAVVITLIGILARYYI